MTVTRMATDTTDKAREFNRFMDTCSRTVEDKERIPAILLLERCFADKMAMAASKNGRRVSIQFRHATGQRLPQESAGIAVMKFIYGMAIHQGEVNHVQTLTH